MQNSTPDKPIQTQPHSKCYLCNREGKLLYSNIKDPLFGAPGEWNIRQCPFTDCGLLWLDPIPLKNDFPKLYKQYYTHGKPDNYAHSRTPLQTIFWRTTLIGFLRRKHKRMYLDGVKPGKLLEIGCGNGKRLALLKSRGWEVIGQEVDPDAAKAAESYSRCKVYVGELQSLSLQSDSFDAIIMNHVLEHVYEPIALLKECHKLLKPTGILVAITPNAESFGHKYFKKYWRGLEVPRHLYLFSPKTLKNSIKSTEFHNYNIHSTSCSAAYMGWASFDIKSRGIFQEDNPLLRNWFKAMLFKILSTFCMLIDRSSGEECVLLARK